MSNSIYEGKKMTELGVISSLGDSDIVLVHTSTGTQTIKFSDLKTQIIGKYSAILTGGNAHNCIYRGKYLGDHITDAQNTAIKNGTFDDLYIGDYWTINGKSYRIIAFNYYYGTGDTACFTNHLVLWCDALYSAEMNATDTTEGGYVGSEMYKTGLEKAKATIIEAFGSSRLLTHRNYFCNAVTDGHQSAGAWFDSTVDLLSERNVYGNAVFGNTNNGTTVPDLYTVDNKIMPYFLFVHHAGSWFWLRDVVNGNAFANYFDNGNASYGNATGVGDVRPAVCIKGI